MFPAIIILAAAPSPSHGDISLADRDAFCIDGPSARAMWRTACIHKTTMQDRIVGWNSPATMTVWLAEVEWRCGVFDKLDDVFFCQISDQSKLRSLARLRELLGEHDYRRGYVPSPLPSYRGP